MAIDWAATATIAAAAIGFAGLVYQQRRHWRETRRDKVRESYAEWMSALSHVRRAEERLLMQVILAQETVRRRAEAGDPLAQQGGLSVSPEDWHRMEMIQQEIERGNRELDVTFSKVCLLDRDWRRIKAAEKVRDMETLVDIQPGEVPSEAAFNERWRKKSKALGELSDLINRTLALEGTFPFLWDFTERKLDQDQEELHARLKTTRRGAP